MAIFDVLGTALGVGGQIFGGITAAAANRRAKKRIRQEKAENQAWFDRRYNEDSTQRADAQRLLSMTAEAIRERNRNARGRQAVSGATPESVQAVQAANAAALSDTAAKIATAGASRKDEVESQYRANKSRLDGRLSQLDAQQAPQTAQSVIALAKSLQNINALSDEDEDEKKKDKNLYPTL